MDNSQLLVALLTSIGYRVPMLIALGVALVMLLDAPRGKIRNAALTGIATLLGTTLLGGLLTVVPLLMIANGNFGGISGMSSVMGVLHMALSLVEALGIVLLCWALVKALRGTAAPLPRT